MFDLNNIQTVSKKAILAFLIIVLYPAFKSSYVYAIDPSFTEDSIKSEEKKEAFVKVETILLKRLNFDTKNISNSFGISKRENINSVSFLNKINVSGFVRFIAIYRNMQKSYSDQESSKRNISFADYPVNVSNPVNSVSNYPLLNLDIKAKPSSNSSFELGYSFGHSYTGKQTDSSKMVTSRSNINLGGSISTKYGVYRLMAGGGVIWTSLSPMTLSTIEYRDVYYERLPWDYYTNSFSRYQDYYATSQYRGSERYGNMPLQGFVLNGDRLPLGFAFTAIYGRSATSVSFDRAYQHFPSMLYAGRLEKTIAGVKLGINYYDQDAYTDAVHYIKDKTEIITGDVRYKQKGIGFYFEGGAGRVLNPANSNDNWGAAFNLTFDMDKSKVKIPFSLKLYSIDGNVASLASSSLNSNPSLVSGGYGNDPLYASSQTFVNVAQEVGQMANNRNGLILKFEKSIGRLNINFGTGISGEIKNSSDSISIQHRVNAFSRSRFRAWYQAGGPYGRIKSVWLRTYENITITDSASDYKKGFNGLDLVLKYKLRLLNRSLILLSFSNYNSIQVGMTPIPVFSSKAFVRTFYEEFSTYYQLSPKYTLVGFFGIERAVANDRTSLSPDNGKPIDQTGHAYGFGIDYDFADNAGIYLRHRWMDHADKNFQLDVFKGQETTLELKLFF
jgi:hypothetical protein